MHTLLRATTALASVLSIAVAVACSSTTTTTDAGPSPTQICPSTIVQATTSGGDAGEGTNSSCHVDGYVCTIGFLCTDNFVQQADCTCTLQMDGTHQFNCILTADKSQVPPGVTDPTTLCVSTQGDSAPNPCPTDKTTASGTVCTNPGEICYYLTQCSGSPPPVDTCQCVGNANGDAGLSWSCDLNTCGDI
jgi:hypothetical protein